MKEPQRIPLGDNPRSREPKKIPLTKLHHYDIEINHHWTKDENHSENNSQSISELESDKTN